MTSLNEKYFPEADFEKEDFSGLISELQKIEDLSVSAEAKEKLFNKLKKIQPKKPFSLLIKNYIAATINYAKPAPAFAMLVIALIIFLFIPKKEVIVEQTLLETVKQKIALGENYQTFENDPEDYISVYEEDTNGDGVFDVISYDLNSDGKIDYITIDYNHDNYTDILAIDTNDDGKMDYFEYDLDFDRSFDHAGVDTTGNEISDTFYIL